MLKIKQSLVDGRSPDGRYETIGGTLYFLDPSQPADMKKEASWESNQPKPNWQGTTGLACYAILSSTSLVERSGKGLRHHVNIDMVP